MEKKIVFNLHDLKVLGPKLAGVMCLNTPKGDISSVLCGTAWGLGQDAEWAQG